MEKGRFATGNNLAGDLVGEATRQPTPAKIRVGADGADLGKSARAHAFARHRHQLARQPYPAIAPQAEGVGLKRAWLGQANQRQAVGRVGLAEFVPRRFDSRPQVGAAHLHHGRLVQPPPTNGQGQRLAAQQSHHLLRSQQLRQRGKTRRMVVMVMVGVQGGKGGHAGRIAPRQPRTDGQAGLGAGEGVPDRLVERMSSCVAGEVNKVGHFYRGDYRLHPMTLAQTSASNTSLPLLQLEAQLHPRVWGGQRLQATTSGQTPIGEAWIVHAANTVIGQNTTLAALAAQYPQQLLGARVVAQTGPVFPLLIKLLDCQDWLSVQVHPDDATAQALAGPGFVGKTEAWHILAANTGAQLIAGVKPGVALEALQAAIMAGDPRALLATQTVTAGQTLMIAAGSVHALGPGLFLYEVQQNSDITYRVYDWGRPASAGRQLHLQESATVARLSNNPAIDLPADGGVLCQCQYFCLESLTAGLYNTENQSFHALTVVAGQMQLITSNEHLTLAPLQSVIVPASIGQYQLAGEFRALRASVG
jgi:mannose-6-phosphate isomerase